MITTEEAQSYPLADTNLGRRLERTEALANAAFVEARADRVLTKAVSGIVDVPREKPARGKA